MQFPQNSIYIVALCAFFLNCYCDKNDVIPPELSKIESFFFEFGKKDLVSPVAEMEENQSFAISQSYSYKEPDERNTQEAIFYKRLIAILLSKLKMQRTDDRLAGTLNIEVFSSEFEYLQNFVNGQGSIREVDRILVNTITQSEHSVCDYMADAFYYFNLLLSNTEYLTHYTSFMKNHEAEIKLMAAQTQFIEMPIACEPHKMSLWDKIHGMFSSTNDCEKYYETIMTNPRLQVTPMLVMTHMFSTAILPLSYLGLLISEFIDNATGKLNFLNRFIITIALFLSICICIILIPFSWIGGSINFGFGPFFRFILQGRQNSNENQDRVERVYERASKKKLKESKKMKRIMLEQNNDLAGGDASRNRIEKCQCENKKPDLDVECVKKEEKDY
ncbi:uncharacterized protein [Mycetomoellerius zeteki]|nr:PREDICTED: uncharacterized protein LOC108721990 [Trachymyrmex zeteki]